MSPLACILQYHTYSSKARNVRSLQAPVLYTRRLDIHAMEYTGGKGAVTYGLAASIGFRFRQWNLAVVGGGSGGERGGGG